MRQVAQLLLMCDRHDIGISIDSDKGRESFRRAGQEGLRPLFREDLRLRQLSGRHRIQRAAVPHAPRAARRHQEADRGVRVRERLSGMRRPGGEHRAAGENGGARHPRPAARRGACGLRWIRRSWPIGCARSSGTPGGPAEAGHSTTATDGRPADAVPGVGPGRRRSSSRVLGGEWLRRDGLSCFVVERRYWS